MTAAEADRFWRFSLHFYERPGVEEDCLRLQDEGGLNVNLALWCCWRALEGERLDEADIRAARERIGEWSVSVTRPLRALRRRVKAELGGEKPDSIPHGLYDRLKRAELEAERAEQALLCRMHGTPRHSGAENGLRHLVETNLETYMRVSGLSAESPLRKVVPDRFARQMTAMSATF